MRRFESRIEEMRRQVSSGAHQFGWSQAGKYDLPAVRNGRDGGLAGVVLSEPHLGRTLSGWVDAAVGKVKRCGRMRR